MNINIIAVIPNYLGGGAETVTDSIVSALKLHGIKVILVTEKVINECRHRVDALYSKVLIANFPLAHYSVRTTQLLADLIRPEQADILWLIGDEFAAIPTLRRALKPDGKILYHLHSIPFFQVRLKDTYYGNRTNRFAYTKWYLLKHMRERLFKSYTRRYMRRTMQTATDINAFITLCKSYADDLRLRYPELAYKFISIYNPAPHYVRNSETPKRKELIYVGRLSFADKRVDNLLRIFAKVSHGHKGWTLRIVGDGPERQNLESLSAELGIADYTEFTGYVDNPSDALSSASILCLTSDIEGWPTALVEAMQHGVVPMAFNCSQGVAELLADGRGILIPPGDIDEYANRLSQLMASPDLRAEITATHMPFLSQLSIDIIINQWKRILLV